MEDVRYLLMHVLVLHQLGKGEGQQEAAAVPWNTLLDVKVRVYALVLTMW